MSVGPTACRAGESRCRGSTQGLEMAESHQDWACCEALTPTAVDEGSPISDVRALSHRAVPVVGEPATACTADMKGLSRIPGPSQGVEDRSELFEGPVAAAGSRCFDTRPAPWSGCLEKTPTRNRAAMHMQKSKSAIPLTSKGIPSTPERRLKPAETSASLR